MNCYFDKNATLYIVSTAFCKHSRTFIFSWFSSGCNTKEKLQTMAIFLNFWSNNIYTHTHTFRARVLVRLLEFFPEKAVKQYDRRKKLLSIQINGNWSHFVLKIESYWYWCDCLSQKNGSIAPFTYWPHLFPCFPYADGGFFHTRVFPAVLYNSHAYLLHFCIETFST